jgi:hypothetical protein
MGITPHQHYRLLPFFGLKKAFKTSTLLQGKNITVEQAKKIVESEHPELRLEFYYRFNYNGHIIFSFKFNNDDSNLLYVRDDTGTWSYDSEDLIHTYSK